MNKNLLPVAVVAAALLAGCGSAQSTTTASTSSAKAVSLQLPLDWDTLDPALTQGDGTYQMLLALYDRVVALGPDGQVEPELATSWTQTANSVTLHIRKGPTCDDGTPVTPTVIANSLRRLGAKATNAPYAERTFGTSGYTVTANDAAHTVTVTTNKPFNDLLLGLGAPWASIVCPKGLADPTIMKTTPEGSGPFTLTDSVRGSSYTLTARSGYDWGPNGESTSSPGFPHHLVFDVIADDTTAANELASGELDIADLDAQPDIQRVSGTSGITTPQKTEAYGAYMLVINEHPGFPGASLTLRRAINAAINAADYAQAQSEGLSPAATNYINSNVPCYAQQAANSVEPFSDAAAKQLLAQAGYTFENGGWYKGGKQLVLTLLDETIENDGPDYLSSALNTIGIKTIVHVVPSSSYIADEGVIKWDLTVFTFAPPMPTPNSITDFIVGPINFAAWDDQAFATAVAAAIAAPPAQRCAAWARAEETTLAHQDVKPLEAPVTEWVGRQGVRFQALTTFELDPLSIRVG